MFLRFDYSDVSFGNTHAQGATVAITCTTGGQPATVEGYDQVAVDFLGFSPQINNHITYFPSISVILETINNR